MAELNDQHHEAHVVSSPSNSSTWSWLISVGFWICLIAATVCYALATLSVRHLENHRLEQQFIAGQVKLRQLAEQVSRYDQFCQQLIHADKGLEPLNSDAQSMKIDKALQFHFDQPSDTTSPQQAVQPIPLAVRFASRVPLLRKALMGLAVALLLFAFTRMNDAICHSSRNPQHTARGQQLTRSPLQKVRRRYDAASDSAAS